jgi:hypothetical protein
MLWIVLSVLPDPRVKGRMSAARISAGGQTLVAGAQHNATSETSLTAVIVIAPPHGA